MRNSEFLEAQKLRLEKEITEISQTIEKNNYLRDWRKTADQDRLNTKRKSLSLVLIALKKLQTTTDQEVVVFYTLEDVFNFTGESKPDLTGGLSKSNYFNKAEFLKSKSFSKKNNFESNLPELSREEVISLRDQVLRAITTRENENEHNFFLKKLKDNQIKTEVNLNSDRYHHYFQEKHGAEYFDFFSDLQIKSWEPKKDFQDLSEFYMEPVLQGKEFSCGPNGIVADMEYVINKKSGAPINLSENFAYAVIRTYEEYQTLTPLRGYLKFIESVSLKDPLLEGVDYGTYLSFREILIDSGITDISAALKFIESVSLKDHLLEDVDYGAYLSSRENSIDSGIADISAALKFLIKNKICPAENFKTLAWLPALNSIPNRNYRITAYTQANVGAHEVDFDFFRILIDHGHPPIVGITTDRRQIFEDWVYPLGNGMMGHVVIVVGYGVGVDPRDLSTKPYLILRDSFVDKKIHYKVPAQRFIDHVFGVYKVIDVEITQ